MTKSFARFWRDECGATAIEYALIASFIAIALVTVLGTVGIEVRGPFSDMSEGMKKRVV